MSSCELLDRRRTALAEPPKVEDTWVPTIRATARDTDAAREDDENWAFWLNAWGED